VSNSSSPEHIHFITGRLAERALRRQLNALAAEVGFSFTVDVLPITVAALMSTRWMLRHIRVPQETTRVLIPGYCQGDIQQMEQQLGTPVERGPRDLRQLPQFFGKDDGAPDDYGSHSIEILAEINHAPRLSRRQIVEQAREFAKDGADIIDVGCEPGDPWTGIADCITALRDEGMRVSVDSLNPVEIAPAVSAGAELVLSVNSTNRAAALDWGVEVVAIPDNPACLEGLYETVEFLAESGVPLRVDPILEPIGFGFANSLGRYLTVRQHFPDAEMMMGVGNLTEMTDADSAGINVLLLGFCQELRIESILTTQVINWARTSVRECDLARKLVHYAVQNGVPPKHLESRLVLLRDEKLKAFGQQELAALARQIKDHNFRLFAEDGNLHLIGGGYCLSGTDPFQMMQELLQSSPKNLDASHAFYLGYEMAKAVTALTLGKEYRQDESLDWGFLTVEEVSLQHRRSRKSPQKDGVDESR
jgi:dihydropteroate synthase